MDVQLYNEYREYPQVIHDRETPYQSYLEMKLRQARSWRRFFLCCNIFWLFAFWWVFNG